MSFANIIGNFIGNVSGGLILPSCAEDVAISWHKNLSTVYTESETISGLLVFDGVNDYVSFPDAVGTNIQGDVTVKWKMYLNQDNFSTRTTLFYFKSDGVSDFLNAFFDGSSITFWASTNVSSNAAYSISGLTDSILECELVKTTSEIVSFSVNGVALTRDINGTGIANDGNYIGYSILYGYLSNTFVWDFEIYNSSNTLIHSWSGQPSGNLSTAWIDQIGSSNGTLHGSPTTTDIEVTFDYVKDSIGTDTRDVYYGQHLDPTSGQIDFKRTSGTFDYTDPTDGSLIEGVSIPSDGLYTVPTNGICEIITSDGSHYPCCERAGTVLHDVNEDSIHISIDSPVWSEGLYGTDYLNQYGFITKTDSDALGYDWETLVDSSTITLDDDCLVPLAQWEYVNIIDSEGEIITDSEGENIQVKENI